MELVSTIIPAYNAAASLPRAIGSVLDQTHRAMEVIVVDDGSSDHSVALVRGKFPTVQILRRPNGGPARARNSGIRAARGSFIAFLDADDYWLPQKIERQLALFRERPELGMVFTDHAYVDAEERLCGVWTKRALLDGDVVRNIFRRSGVTTSTVMVRREALDAVGLFEEELVTSEDDNLWMRIAARYPIALIEEPLVVYRVADGSASRTPGMIFSGVGRHLELLESRPDYAPLRERLGSLVSRKWASIHFAEGTHAFRDGDMPRAREHLRHALRYRPWHRRAWAYLAATLLPQGAVEALKRAKRAVGERALARP